MRGTSPPTLPRRARARPRPARQARIVQRYLLQLPPKQPNGAQRLRSVPTSGVSVRAVRSYLHVNRG